MIELGLLQITDTDGIVLSRRKIRRTAIQLGFAEVMAARLEAAFSEICRATLTPNEPYSIRVSIAQEKWRPSLRMFFSGLLKKPGKNYTGRPFNRYSVTQNHNGLFQVDTYCLLVDEPVLTTEFLDELRQELAAKSRAELMRELESKNAELNLQAGNFIPVPFLDYLGKESIVDIKAGDHVEKEITVLFSDIRSYTSISENMASIEIFEMLNNYLEYAVSAITRNDGFIDKFIGDAIMAIFASPDNALRAVIELRKSLAEYNEKQKQANGPVIRIGVGLHHGLVTLGTVGTKTRMDTTIIGDTVNLASRLESATKTYAIDVIISGGVFQSLPYPDRFHIREIDTVRVKGKKIPIVIYDVFDCDEESIRVSKLEFLPKFNEAIQLYKEANFKEALDIFMAGQEKCPDDTILPLYIKRCNTFLRIPPGSDWSWVTGLVEK